jgi:antitoxin (DNA-binding transcriptional repressor) of toxin-antitoxin stability system
MTTDGVRELKNRLSKFLRRVADGEWITVTDRGRPIAVLGLPGESPDAAFARELMREGLASWSGGEPRGTARRIRLHGEFISETVIEERR